jgi:alkylated DNA repair dioxygenase AlkB
MRPIVNNARTYIDSAETAWVYLASGWVQDHDELTDVLLEELKPTLRVEKTQMYGKTIHIPRETSWHGSKGDSYAYSGLKHDPHPWTPTLATIRDRLTVLTGTDYNSVLANYYRDGDDSVSWHADDEAELGPSFPADVRIASVSFGAHRRFLLRANDDHKDRYEIYLGCGDLLIMGGATQSLFKHSVPKTRRNIDARLNLTFRVRS